MAGRGRPTPPIVLTGDERKTLERWARRQRGVDLADLAEEINPQVRDWFNYYGTFYRPKLYLIARRIDQHLVRWAMQKFKRLRGSPRRAWAWLSAVRPRQPRLFAHWALIARPSARPVGAG